MFEPWVPAVSAAAGGGALAVRDYLRKRLRGHEDRYMALYSRARWEAANMDIVFHFDPARDEHVKGVFRARLSRAVAASDPASSLFHEVGRVDASGIHLEREHNVDLDALASPRRNGIRVDWERSGQIRIVWNHVQTDGVGLWEAFRETFDPSPPLVTYADAGAPPPFLPELLGLPLALRRLFWRGRLDRLCGTGLSCDVQLWPTAPIRELKSRMGADFNLVSAALMLDRVFRRHPEVRSLCTALVVFFPFLRGRNRYGVMLVRVRRDTVEGMVRQIERQVRFPLLRWGAASAQSYALARLPDRLFERAITYYRGQIDVLISNLPVGTKPARLDGVPVTISCHPWEPGSPYYFLAVGTRDRLHLSVNSRFPQAPDFMAAPR